MVALVEAGFVVGVHGDADSKAVLIALAHLADENGRVGIQDGDNRTLYALNIERLLGEGHSCASHHVMKRRRGQ
jgi:hypothetical protein